MTSWQRTLFPSAVLALVLLGALAWEARVDVRSRSVDRAREALVNLAGKAAKVDGLALAACSGELATFDPLVHELKEISELTEALVAMDPATAHDADTSAFVTRLKKRVEQVERLKSSRGALTNTEMHLPDLLERMRGASRGADDQRLLMLQDGIVRFALASGKDALASARTAANIGANDPLAPVAAHVDVLLREGPVLAGMAPTLRDDSLARAVAELDGRYEGAFTQAEKKTRVVRDGFLIVALLVCVGAIWLSRR